MPELTNMRHELFARAYISNYGNRTQAARDAGYSPQTAAKQGSRLWNDDRVRARIKELSADLDESTLDRMEDTKAAIYRQAWILASSDNPKAAAAAVQALRLIMDMQLLGPDGEKLAQNRDKLNLDRERLELQKEAIKAGECAKDVRITLDSSLMDAIK